MIEATEHNRVVESNPDLAPPLCHGERQTDFKRPVHVGGDGLRLLGVAATQVPKRLGLARRTRDPAQQKVISTAR